MVDTISRIASTNGNVVLSSANLTASAAVSTYTTVRLMLVHVPARRTFVTLRPYFCHTAHTLSDVQRHLPPPRKKTDADAVTFAPTAFYGYCPPLYMSPIQLAEYMTTVLCVDTDTPQRLSDDLCTYLNDMRNKTFPERRCALTASPMAR